MTEDKKPKTSKEMKEQFESGRTYFNQCSIKPSKKEKGSWLIKCKERHDNVEKVKVNSKEE